MKHYDYVEWLLYKTKALSDESLEEMEDHLYNCDMCMEIFISLIDEEELEKAEKVIPEDFTPKVMKKVSNKKIKRLEPRNHKKLFNYEFGYYVAIASVTIFLTVGGFYTNLVDAVPKVVESIKIDEDRPNLVGNFTDNIVNSTSSFILRFENVDRIKEVK